MTFTYPFSKQLGLITPPTPFVNGRPFTLYLNESVFEDGAVGLALLRSPSSSVLSVEWEGMELLSPLVCEVKECVHLSVEAASFSSLNTSGADSRPLVDSFHSPQSSRESSPRNQRHR